MNVFRMTPDRSLDRYYLRTCAIYRLLKSGRIGKADALAMQHRRIRGLPKQRPNRLTATIEIWCNGPLKGKFRP